MLLAKSNMDISFLQTQQLSRKEIQGMCPLSFISPLDNSFLSKKELDAIEWRTINTFLSKTGDCKKDVRTTVYGLCKLGQEEFCRL